MEKFGLIGGSAPKKKPLISANAFKTIGAGMRDLSGVMGNDNLSQVGAAIEQQKERGRLETEKQKRLQAIQTATQNMAPEQQAFALANPEVFAQMQAKNLFPNEVNTQDSDTRRTNAKTSQGRLALDQIMARIRNPEGFDTSGSIAGGQNTPIGELLRKHQSQANISPALARLKGQNETFGNNSGSPQSFNPSQRIYNPETNEEMELVNGQWQSVR